MAVPLLLVIPTERKLNYNAVHTRNENEYD